MPALPDSSLALTAVLAPATLAVGWLALALRSARTRERDLRRELTAEIDTTTEALQASQARLRQLLDSLPCGVAVFDRQQRLVEHNARFRQQMDLGRLAGAQGQPLEAHVRWMRANGYENAEIVLPHDGANNGGPSETWADAWRNADNNDTVKIKSAHVPSCLVVISSVE